MSKRFAALRHDDRGLAVAEYAVALIAVVAFATVLYTLLRGSLVSDLLGNLIKKALTFVS